MLPKFIGSNLAVFFITILLTFIQWGNLTFYGWLDTTFLLSLVLLLIGGVLLIVQGGFTKVFTNSIKKFALHLNKTEQHIRDIEGKKSKNQFHSNRKFQFLPYILIPGVTLFILSMMVTAFIM